ncbi:MAG TPA: tetratricopeptide repeat protein, partial [Saprospiraceae bacterium]|nr:tetratricopeptide repeat protein [Saprospiraceae bacterium]
HQIGVVHERAQNYPAAERAYQESLEIEIREKNMAGEASSLGQLGNLYNAMGRLEDALRMYERAAGIYAQLKDARYEGFVRNNLANTLLKLRRPAEARTELQRAIECDAQFGHAARPWTTWAILSNLETSEGNSAAATTARQKAMSAYAAYRRDGGESQSDRFPLIEASKKAIQEGQQEAMIAYLESTLEPGDPIRYVACIRALLSLLRGQASAGLADDPELYYMDAVEIGALLPPEGG